MANLNVDVRRSLGKRQHNSYQEDVDSNRKMFAYAIIMRKITQKNQRTTTTTKKKGENILFLEDDRAAHKKLKDHTHAFKVDTSTVILLEKYYFKYIDDDDDHRRFN